MICATGPDTEDDSLISALLCLVLQVLLQLMGPVAALDAHADHPLGTCGMRGMVCLLVVQPDLGAWGDPAHPDCIDCWLSYNCCASICSWPSLSLPSSPSPPVHPHRSSRNDVTHVCMCEAVCHRPQRLSSNLCSLQPEALGAEANLQHSTAQH